MGSRSKTYFLIGTILLFTCLPGLSQESRSLVPEAKFIVAQDNNEGPSEIYEQYEKGNYEEFKKGNPSFKMGFGTTIWSKFTLDPEEYGQGRFVIELDYPRFDSVYFYQVLPNKKIVQLAISGDAFPFYDRTYHYRTHILPIELKDGPINLMIRSVKTGDSSYPLYIWENQDFLENQEKTNLFYGIFFGILLCAVMINIILFVSLGRAIYIYYFLYTFFLMLFLLTNFGYSQFLIWPEQPRLNNDGFFIIAQVTVVFFLLFVREFLHLKKNQPIISKFIIPGIVLVLVLYIPLLQFLQYSATLKLYYGVLASINYSLYIIVFGSSLILGIIGAIKKDKNARIFVFCFSIAIVGILCHTLRVLDIIPYTIFTGNALLLGSIFEVFLLTIGIGFQLKEGFEERNKLLLEVNSYQKQMVTAVVSGQEAERNRIGRELHDGIGSTLSALKLKFEDLLDKKWIESLDKLIIEIRELSHALISPRIAENGFLHEVESLILLLNENEKVFISLIKSNWPENIDPKKATVLFRIIQEALQNIIKHAGATTASLQLIGDEKEIVVVIEDNGKGFIGSEIGEGVGLENIKSRVLSINGHITLDSSEDYGTVIFINVPLEEMRKEKPPVVAGDFKGRLN